MSDSVCTPAPSPPYGRSEERVATVAQCRQAMDDLAALIAGSGGDAPDPDLTRTVSCRIRDLDVIFGGQLRGGQLHDVGEVDRPDADIRLTTTGDDLVALVDGSLGFAGAWASGRLKVQASVFDLLRLRKLL